MPVDLAVNIGISGGDSEPQWVRLHPGSGMSFSWDTLTSTATVTCTAPPGGSGAPLDAGYIVVNANNASLTSERRLSVSSGLTLVVGAADSVVTIREWPYYSYCTVSADTSQTNLALQNSALSFVLSANKLYKFKAQYVFRTQATTTGLRFGLTCPAFNRLAATGQVPVAAGGTGGVYHSYITASGVSVTGTGVALANVDYLANLEGIIEPSAGGNLIFQWSSEINASRVTMRQGSIAELWQITP